MSERDELALAIRQNFSGWMGPDVSYDVADAILAAGYSKPSDELAKVMRGAKTLGEIIEKQCRDVLEVTGLHHLINEDGDGHWDVVWMRLFEMREELASLKESTIGRERLRGDSWRDRSQAMELARADAVERAEAAAPSIQAAALESAADAIEEDPYDALDPYYADWLRDRARKIREEAAEEDDPCCEECWAWRTGEQHKPCAVTPGCIKAEGHESQCAVLK